MYESNWMAILSSQIWTVPFYLIYLVGVVLALVYWRRHPVVSLLCVVAFAIFLGSRLVGAGFQLWIMQSNDRGASHEQLAIVIGIVSSARVFFDAIGWILILTAMFGWRTARVEPGPFKPG